MKLMLKILATLYLLLLFFIFIIQMAIRQYKLLFLVLFLLSIFSCKKDKLVKDENLKISIDTTKAKDKKEIRNIGETLLPEAKKKIKNWKEYQQVDELLTNFYSISPNEALEASTELATFTQQLKDSVNIDRFKEKDIGIRLNVLYNYALRLEDMSTIEAIKTEEVKEEIENILNAFSALNSKINNISNQEKLETELKTLNIE